MQVAVVGGGMLGLTLAHRLVRQGHEVEVFEGAPVLGGLACAHDFGEFTWDRFYHCILPQDGGMLGLLGELGLTDELRWRTTGTGYYARGVFHDMSGNRDFLRFPLLSLLDKVRLGAAILYATRVADPLKLHGITAAEWLGRICGRRTYEVFWKPLLKAKLGSHHDRVAAVFIWATLKRLFGARAGGANREKLGYVSGGYARILERLATSIREGNGQIHVEAAVTSIRTATPAPGEPPACDVTWRSRGERPETRAFDQVIFTAPTRLARGVVSQELLPGIDAIEQRYPPSSAYLGVACLVLALKQPLTPYYVLNIGDEAVEMTGLIEMTNLVDRDAETKGRALVYLPRYLDSEDPLLAAPDEALRRPLLENGLKRLFPRFAESEIVYQGVHRARLVQPLPLVTAAPVKAEGPPALTRPFQLLGTYMLQSATLNNNEVVGLVDAFLGQSAEALRPAARAGASVLTAAAT